MCDRTANSERIVFGAMVSFDFVSLYYEIKKSPPTRRGTPPPASAGLPRLLGGDHAIFLNLMAAPRKKIKRKKSLWGLAGR
ncbi:hypothetical protein ES703_90598 [subsurface metagenome]